MKTIFTLILTVFASKNLMASQHFITLESVYHDEKTHTMIVTIKDRDVGELNFYRIFETNTIDAHKIAEGEIPIKTQFCVK